MATSTSEPMTRPALTLVRGTGPSPVLADGAVYFGDNGRRLCSSLRCGGSTAVHSGRDLSGQPVARASVDDAAAWQGELDLGPLDCECGAVVLVPIACADGWPVAR